MKFDVFKKTVTFTTAAMAGLFIAACSPENFSSALPQTGTVSPNGASNPGGPNNPGNPGNPGTPPVFTSTSLYLNAPTALFGMNAGQALNGYFSVFNINGFNWGVNDIAISQQGAMYAVSTWYENSYNSTLIGNAVYLLTSYSTNPGLPNMELAPGLQAFPSTAPGDSLADVMLNIPASIGPLNGSTMKDETHMVLAAQGLYILDLTNGGVSLIPGTQNYASQGDVIYLPDGNLYWTTYAAGVNPIPPTYSSSTPLMRVNPQTGQTTFVGNIPIGQVYGLAYVSGKLTGITLDGHLITINPSNAAITSSVQLSQGDWHGATSYPIYF